METLLTLPALGFADDDHDVADLVLVGRMTGEWQAFQRSVARGLELEDEHSAAVGAVDVEGALKAFRYQRRLIAAAELRAWLAERRLTLRELQGVLRRTLLRERFGEPSSRARPTAGIAGVMRAEAICTGTLARCAEALLRWHAGRQAVEAIGGDESVFSSTSGSDPEAVDFLLQSALRDESSGLPSLGAEELRGRAERLVALCAAHERFEATAVTDAAVATRLEERRLEWTSVSGSELAFEVEGAALETRLHVVHDAHSLDEVGAMVGLAPAPRELDLGSAAEEIGGELLTARCGDLVGPWYEEERWRVLVLDRRVEPSVDDARACSRAREELLAELVDRFSAGKAVQLAPL